MPEPRPPIDISRDPHGYYARLGVDPWAAPDAITAAWRRNARVVHPDVPQTGDAAAFLELKRAYDVLIDNGKRAEYDRSARQTAPRMPPYTSPHTAQTWRDPGEIGATPYPEMRAPPTRHPRLRDLPTAVWAGTAVVLLIGVFKVGSHLMSPPPPAHRETISATAWDVPPLSPDQAVELPYGPAPVHLAGTPNFYIVPGAGAAMLWRVDEAQHTLVPWRQLPAFSPVQAIRLLKPSGMVEIKVSDTANGYVDAARLTPGDAASANRAWCTYNAGPTPANGEVLSRANGEGLSRANGEGLSRANGLSTRAAEKANRVGHASLSINNRSGQLAVVKIRSTDGSVIASIFLGPDGQSTLDGLPEQPVLLDYATGEVWSRGCHGFAAGMRALRLPQPISIGTVRKLAIPSDTDATPVELSDQAFEQEQAAEPR